MEILLLLFAGIPFIVVLQFSFSKLFRNEKLLFRQYRFLSPVSLINHVEHFSIQVSWLVESTKQNQVEPRAILSATDPHLLD